PSGGSKEKRRAVNRAEREMIFSREPVRGLGAQTARVVIYDRMTVTKPSYGTKFIFHGGSAPELLRGGIARFTVGRSSAQVTTLVPVGASPIAVDETNNKEGDRAYFTNKPPDATKSVRVEVGSPAAATTLERRFLHAIVVGPALERKTKDKDKDKEREQ